MGSYKLQSLPTLRTPVALIVGSTHKQNDKTKNKLKKKTTYLLSISFV